MKHLAVLLFALSTACAVHAQAQPEASPQPEAQSETRLRGEAADRERIRSERAAAAARLKEAQIACRARFAVTGCSKAAAREYNAIQSELRRQEGVLDDAERTRRAAAHQKSLDERLSPERQQEAERKRAAALAEQKDREARATESAAKKAADVAKKAAQPPRVKTPSAHGGPQGTPRSPLEPKSHGPTPEEAAHNRAEHEARLQAAERHRVEVQERIAKRTKPAASALPSPR
ncbi:hypothetical protein [Ramlibacter sp.]|uniref:hypothetical protein n=1 Tax=Ramlibacter sp. TaxID=1917967 RepID=UPI00262BF69F|nr:hypothetical protein [Ramlibacter sp.]MDB5954236.1 hypothetical protein [Ramlibacter sp.]